jgi:hypothetical protein
VEAVAGGAGTGAAAVAAAVTGWAAAHRYVQVTGGTGVSYPSITMSADTGRASSRYRGVLSLYGSPEGERPFLEIRVKLMCSTPPYLCAGDRERLMKDLRALGIPRLDDEPALASKRPNIPLDQLTGGRIQALLSLVDQWISDVRAHAGDAETD